MGVSESRPCCGDGRGGDGRGGEERGWEGRKGKQVVSNQQQYQHSTPLSTIILVLSSCRCHTAYTVQVSLSELNYVCTQVARPRK